MRELNQIRQDINQVDAEMRALYLRRMALAGEVAQAKLESGDAVFKPARERQIIEMHTQGLPDDLQTPYANHLKTIMRVSRASQYRTLLHAQPTRFPFALSRTPITPEVVFYQGTEGAYQQLAAHDLFPDCRLQSVPSWALVFQSVHTGKADAGVVPLTNTTAGAVSEVYDLLLEYDLFINACHVRPIHHCLAGLPGAQLAEVREVCSHAHALSQCRSFLQAHDLCTRTMANTAIAAQAVAQQGDTRLAAICSHEAAARYGLTVLADDVSDTLCNETRFIAISPQRTALPDDNRLALALRLPHQAGALGDVLSLFADYGLNLTEIHSRPVKDSPWRYVFYLDVVGNAHDPAVQALLYQLHEELPYSKVLGSYRAEEDGEETSPCC